jgi:hypothetical protein
MLTRRHLLLLWRNWSLLFDDPIEVGYLDGLPSFIDSLWIKRRTLPILTDHYLLRQSVMLMLDINQISKHLRVLNDMLLWWYDAHGLAEVLDIAIIYGEEIDVHFFDVVG